jgi:hypothetical protein
MYSCVGTRAKSSASEIIVIVISPSKFQAYSLRIARGLTSWGGIRETGPHRSLHEGRRQHG